jgi:lysophospholipase L1-like esterase
MSVQEVCLFGDSIARGVVLDAQGTYKPIKECFASLAAKELGVELINKARFGCTITKGLEIIGHFLDKIGSEARRLAFLEFGGNDCDFHWDRISAEPQAEHLPATPPAHFARIYGEVIHALKTKGFRPVLMTLPPLDAERYFAWFTRTGLDKRAILGWLGDVQFIYRWHESYSDVIWEIGESWQVPVVDIRRAFLEQRHYSRFLCEDGIHPNADGHRLITSEIVQFARERQGKVA